MKYHYQIIVLGKIDARWFLTENLLFEQIETLGLQRDFYQIIRAKDYKKQYHPGLPTYAIYYGDADGNFKDLDEVQELLKEGNTILPVYDESFSTEIPEELSNYNGLDGNGDQNARVVNLVLEAFGRLRNTRKVFISYKRSESTSVAIQLYEALEKHNFDVFLDTHSIIQGEEFQEELWHRMTDCDVVVMLNTEEFMKSHWCGAELAEAGARQIGVIQLVWPDHKLEPTAELSYVTQLKESDFKGKTYKDADRSRLKNKAVNDILSQVESVRAGNMAARQKSLISDFMAIARHEKKTMYLQHDLSIRQQRQGKPDRVFIPTVGVPTSVQYNASSDLKQRLEDFKKGKVYLIYDDLRIREKWIEHLNYLDQHLDVKTIKKQKFGTWISKH